MSVYLYVVRHGEAIADFTDDKARQLTEHGEWEAKRTGLWISTQVKTLDAVFCSPYIRAQQTCDILCKNWIDQKFSKFNVAQLIPSGSHQRCIDEMLAYAQLLAEETDTDRHIICVSHMPIVSYLVGELTGFTPVLATAAVAKIKLDTESWTGVLETLISPDQML